MARKMICSLRSIAALRTSHLMILFVVLATVPCNGQVTVETFTATTSYVFTTPGVLDAGNVTFEVTASTTGLVVTTGDDFTSPEFDEGAIWGYDGANMGQIRKITSTGATAATVTVAFDEDTVVGDNFLIAPFWPLDDGSVVAQLTTNFTEIDASIAVGTGAELICIEIGALDLTREGTLKSYGLFVSNDHWFNKLA